jgi:hypothetical protein
LLDQPRRLQNPLENLADRPLLPLQPDLGRSVLFDARRAATGMTVRTDFSVRPGAYMVRLVARDSEGQMLTATSASLSIP